MRLNSVRVFSPVLLAGTLTMSSVRAQAYDWVPTAPDTVVSTDFTMLTPVGAAPINITGGIFVFRNVTIPAGRTVRGVGSRPMVWIVTNEFRVEGTLSVDGADGDSVTTIGSANFPSAGGAGACSGGAGGAGSPNTTARSVYGQQGFDAYGVSGVGGSGGQSTCRTGSSYRGSGGGGGSFATVGDPSLVTAASASPQIRGVGGIGDPWVFPAGPGERPFSDSSSDNDFIGLGFDLHRGRVVPGELRFFRGGQGGGGGGDRLANCLPGSMFHLDEKGGGGGGGGGCLVIYALNRIVVGPQGLISADGGGGGGGEPAGSSDRGGGGGGGSGGLIVLAAQNSIVLHAHGSTYASGDTDFSITADGGIGLQSGFRGRPITDKYDAASQANTLGSVAGGFGGLGIVQLMTPPGDNSDGTNTVFDDRIVFVRNGGVVSAAEKMDLLAWRGWPNFLGSQVDDAGLGITVTGAGDIRPSPILLPLF